MTDLEMDQQSLGYFPSEPCALLRGTNVPQPNIHTVARASGNATNLDSHYLLDAYDNVMMYGVTQYTGFQLQHNVPANIYYCSRSQAPNVNGRLLDNANMGMQRYHDAASNRSGLRFRHPSVNAQHHNYHHPAVPVQGMRSQNINFHSPVTAASYGVPTIPSRSAVIPTQNGFEIVARHVGLSPSAGPRIYGPQRGVMPGTILGHRNLPPNPMGFFQVDDVAILDDSHRDMRLVTEDMSYEELLALGERIGKVSTGLTEEMITRQLTTKTCLTPEVAASEDQQTDSCIICQDEYQNQEKIGILQCGHEYHADCLGKWLLVKNVCPICKSEGLTPGGKDV